MISIGQLIRQRIRARIAILAAERELRRNAALFKRAKSAHTLSRHLINYEVRNIDPNLSIPGDSDKDDNIVFIVAARLIDVNLDDALTKIEAENADRISDLRKLAIQSNEVKEALARERTMLAFLYKLANSDEKAAAALGKAKALWANATEINASTLRDSERLLRKRLRRLHEDISDRLGFKLDVSLSDLAGLAAIWSVLFAVSGYLYTSTLLQHFGIDASAFLGIGDYLAASVDHLKYAALSTVWGALVFLGGAFEGSRKSRAQIRVESVTKERIRSSLWLLVGVASLAAGWAYFTQRELFFALSNFVGILLSFAIADYVASRAFAKPTQAAAILTAVLTFGVHIVTGVGSQIFRIESGTWQPKMKATLTLKDAKDESLKDAVVLVGASNFVVLLDQSSKRVVVVARERIQEAEIRPTSAPKQPLAPSRPLDE